MLITARRPAAVAAAVAVVVLVLAAAGCGGSGELDHHGFVTRANEQCRDANRKVAALDTPAQTLEGLAKYAQRVQPVTKELVDNLGALKPPKADRAAFGRYLSSLRSNLARLSQLRDAAGRRDAQAVGRVARAMAARRTDPAAVRLGLSECARHPVAGAA